MPRFSHQRHKMPRDLARSRDFVVACTAMKSNVNLSRILRLAGCCGVTRIVTSGRTKVDPKVARDAVETVSIEAHRSLVPALKRFRADGYRLVGLEQATESQDLHEYKFRRRTVLVVGNERTGLTDDILAELDDVVEIPVWGLPYSYNVATATAMALYEYCRQFPNG